MGCESLAQNNARTVRAPSPILLSENGAARRIELSTFSRTLRHWGKGKAQRSRQWLIAFTGQSPIPFNEVHSHVGESLRDSQIAKI